MPLVIVFLFWPFFIMRKILFDACKCVRFRLLTESLHNKLKLAVLGLFYIACGASLSLSCTAPYPYINSYTLPKLHRYLPGIATCFFRQSDI